MNGEDKMKKISLFLAIVMLFILVGCSKQPEETNTITLQDVISTEEIDFSDRNTEMNIWFKFEYNYNNTYKNTVLNFYNTLDEYIITEAENTHNYNDEGIYISFWSFDYNHVGFEVYDDDIIRISKGTDFLYYKCDGVYDTIKKDIDILTTEADKYYKIEYTEFLYTYTIFDKNGNVIFEDTTNRDPHIFLVDENTVVKWIQSGTGILTRGAYFYNYDTGEISNLIWGQIDWHNGYVCSACSGAVYVHKIFGSDEVKVYDGFDKQIASFIENVQSARFINDGKQIEVKYWTELEDTNELQTQIFDVDKPDRIATYDVLFNN